MLKLGIGTHICDTTIFIDRSVSRSWDAKPQLYGTVEDGATIGALCIIACGVTIGAFAYVEAGSVVMSDVKPFHVVAGNPAQAIAKVCPCGKSRFGVDSFVHFPFTYCCTAVDSTMPDAVRAAAEEAWKNTLVKK